MKEHKWEAAVENGQDIFSASLAHEEEEHEIRVVEKLGNPDLLIFAEG